MHNDRQPHPLEHWTHRPLIWFAPAVAVGCYLGAEFALQTRGLTRTSPLLCLPLALGLLAAMGSVLLGRISKLTILISICFVLCGAGATVAAWRYLPPINDVSTLASESATVAGPLTPVPATLYGWVASDPQRGENNQSFVLALDTVAATAATSQRGNVWITAPRMPELQIGDSVVVPAELMALPLTTTVEGSEAIRYIGRGCWCRARVPSAEKLQLVRHTERYPLERWISTLRVYLLDHYIAAFSSGRSDSFPVATAQLLTAIVFGVGGLADPLPRETSEQFRAAGLAHLLVASGAQIALLGGLLLFVARLAGLHRWWLFVGVTPQLLFYALLAGSGPSIWRAGIIGVCLALALTLGRDVDNLSLWSLAWTGLLLHDPLQFFEVGFRLTFAATWGILVFAQPISAFIRKQIGAMPGVTMVSASLSAQACTLPLLLHHFGRCSLVGLAANLLAVPLSAVLVVTGITGLLVPIGAFNYFLTTLITRVAAGAAEFHGASIDAPPLSGQGTLFCYVALLSLTVIPIAATVSLRDVGRSHLQAWRRRRDGMGHYAWQSMVVLLALGVTAATSWWAWSAHRHLLQLALLNVGQGECIVVHGTGRTVLLDGGSSSMPGDEAGRGTIVPYLQSHGVNHIDAMIISHADADHCNALLRVLQEVPVVMAIDGGNSHGIDEIDYQQLKTELRRRRIPVVAARAGQSLDLGDGAALRVLAPVQPLLRGDNNNGAVVRLDYGQTSALLTADIEREAEERLVRRGANLRCTVLKLAHHGSQTSSSPLLLNGARPQAAILSCGRYNSFGHPATATLNRLQQQHIPVFRTDLNGTILVTSDGRECWIQPEHKS